jgi:hypothetical protein
LLLLTGTSGVGMMRKEKMKSSNGRTWIEELLSSEIRAPTRMVFGIVDIIAGCLVQVEEMRDN